MNRQGENDAIHVVVIDDYGVVSGIEGNVLEKHLSLSKSEDSISSVNSPQKDYYKNYIADFSTNLYAGYNPSATVDAYHTTIDEQDTYWNTIPTSIWFLNRNHTLYQCTRPLGSRSTQNISVLLH